MESFKKQAAQGDILITKLDKLPESHLVEMKPSKGQYIVAHSETGHHHTVQEQGVNIYQSANDSMVMYLVTDNDIELKHNRSFYRHDSLRICKGIYEIRRQREYTPEGWRRVTD